MINIRFRLSTSELGKLERKAKEFKIKVNQLIKSIALRSELVNYPTVTTKNPKVNRRINQITISFFDEELEVVKTKAESMNMSISNFVMFAALNCSFVNPKYNRGLK